MSEINPVVIEPEKPLLLKIVQFPLVRFLIFFIVIAIALSGLQALASQIINKETASDSVRFAVNLIISLVVLFVYVGLVKLIERRSATELSPVRFGVELGFGLLVGAGAMVVSIGAIGLLGGYTVVGVNSPEVLWGAAIVGLVPGIVEEILFRGILFRMVEEKLGSIAALVVSSLVFGLAHIANPNATLFSSIAITVEAGLLLGAAYMLTRRLWFAIGIHAAWNFTQGGIFGVAVSGSSQKGLLESTMQGNELVSGGAFGAEASIIALAICTAIGGVVLWLAIQKGNWVSPFWVKSKPSASLSVSSVSQN
jgi:uncharacterized protein